MSRLLPRLARRWPSLPDWQLKSSKFERILQLCENRDVLDCGCVGSKLETPSAMSATSHFRIAEVAHHCVGVDIIPEEVEKRKAAGYDVRLANVETMDLGETFDVVVAADLIEHVSNAGLFLDRARDHLRDSGFLCVVTPNPSSFNMVAKALMGVSAAVNPEHTCWYDPVTLGQLLQRHRFDPEEWYWQDYQRHPLTALGTRLRPNLAAHFIVVARKRERGHP